MQFTDESSGEELNYEWDFNNDGIYDSYEQNPEFIFADTGYYSVKLKVTNPNNNDSITKFGYIYVKDTTTQIIDKNPTKKINIFPVPADNQLFVEVSGSSSNGFIEIFDLKGNMIKRKTDIKTFNELDISFLNEGIYIIKVVNNKNQYYNKFLKN